LVGREERKMGNTQDGRGTMQLATHVVHACPCLRPVGLMTIGGAGGGERDFVVLREARNRPARVLLADGAWGECSTSLSCPLSRVACIARHRSGFKSRTVSPDGALEQCATRSSRLNILDDLHLKEIWVPAGLPVSNKIQTWNLSREVIRTRRSCYLCGPAPVLLISAQP
jgi:hypothetical protein